jgi:hypothetical protein
MSHIITEFLNRCFAPSETIALLLRRERPASVAQRVLRLERVMESRYQAWLSYENGTGANVYVAANPLLAGSRKRTKESFASVRHIYIDIDVDGEARLASIQNSDCVPAPTVILSTSPAKYQALWRVEGFDFEQQEETLKRLAMTFGGDPACTDRNRVLRLPGFLNWKYDPPYRVTAKYPDDSIWTPDDFRLDTDRADGMRLTSARTPRNSPLKHSNSEDDWAWVCHQLVRGRNSAALTKELASRRFDKPNPLYYARRTVDLASARLLLLEGYPVEVVIATLEDRRRDEIANSLCCARAREIAMTAQRMIRRKRFA